MLDHCACDEETAIFIGSLFSCIVDPINGIKLIGEKLGVSQSDIENMLQNQSEKNDGKCGHTLSPQFALCQLHFGDMAPILRLRNIKDPVFCIVMAISDVLKESSGTTSLDFAKLKTCSSILCSAMGVKPNTIEILLKLVRSSNKEELARYFKYFLVNISDSYFCFPNMTKQFCRAVQSTSLFANDLELGLETAMLLFAGQYSQALNNLEFMFGFILPKWATIGLDCLLCQGLFASYKDSASNNIDSINDRIKAAIPLMLQEFAGDAYSELYQPLVEGLIVGLNLLHGSPSKNSYQQEISTISGNISKLQEIQIAK